MLKTGPGPCRVVVLVSGGGTNLHAHIVRVKDGSITTVELAGVISKNKNASVMTSAGENGLPER